MSITRIKSYGLSDGAVTADKISSAGGSFTFRNKIINGNFDIWQRGTSQTSSGYDSADRWNILHSGSTKTASRESFTTGQTEVPGEPTYFMRHVVTSSTGVDNYVLARQKIESVRTLAGKTATLSFWAKADSTKNISVELERSFGSGGSPSTVENGIGVNKIQLTSSWVKYTVVVNIPSISGKTLGSNNNDWIGIYFWFDAGSNFNSRTDSLGHQSGTFDIAQVQLEEGSVATPFEQRPIGLELSMCQRYYEICKIFTQQYGSGSNYAGRSSNFSVTKRVSPTVTLNITSSGGYSSALTAQQITEYSYGFNALFSGSGYVYVNVFADAEL